MDKIEQIKAEIERLKSQLIIGACSSQVAMETACKKEAYNEILSIIDNLTEGGTESQEKVYQPSEDLEEEVLDWVGKFNPAIREEIQSTAYHFAGWQKEQKPKIIQWTGNNLKEVIDFTGKSPRFGEWFKSWEEYENYVHIHNDILKLFCEDGSHYEVPIGAWIVKTPDGHNIPSLFRFIQNLAEWSEDDEADANLILKELEQGKEYSPDYSRHFTRLIDWFTNRLKSLRPKPHWKPSEDLEKAAENWCKENNQGIALCPDRKSHYLAEGMDAFKAGAQWQKEQMEERWLKDRDGCFWDGVEEGKKAMKEQMMKGAVEGIVRKTHQRISIRYTNKNGIFDYFYCQSGDFKVGDRVKIIVIKEDKK